MNAKRSGRDVIRSVEDEHGERCVDFIARTDGTIVFKVYRKDPEDHGRWSLLSDHSAVAYSSEESAYKAARERFGWLPLVSKS